MSYTTSEEALHDIIKSTYEAILWDKNIVSLNQQI